MQKNYDDFTKMKPKEMSKTISDMTYNYINPETNMPTIVPASHYEKILNRVREEYGEIIVGRYYVRVHTSVDILRATNPIHKSNHLSLRNQLTIESL